MDVSRFVIEASEAESMANQAGLSVKDLLSTLVGSSQKLARCPISNFSVAAVGLGSDGRIFLGVNLEFPGVPLHHSVHAEQFLITNLSLNLSPGLSAFAVSAAPCGHCRQFLQEVRNASKTQILITTDESPKFNPLSLLLPIPFGPYDLLDEETPLLPEPHDNRLKFLFIEDTTKPCNLSNGSCELYKKNRHLLKEEALKAANNSHAPYSGSPSGIALMDCEGRIYKGSYLESAAFNPSLGPVQTALISYVASGGGYGYERIVAAVLVEKEAAPVMQEDTAKLLLKVVSPKCHLQVFHCVSDSDSDSIKKQ
ncbi:cytidine deaminase 1 [Impatiens glandulifera]|uniref:cytidine deaminase 1 n=1 Tax=Impatiens glandulifera TaxID=253017 RepID=UPI001FB0F8EB|nr:cytidine deaminase 1 [Impatiens glandulifera]